MRAVVVALTLLSFSPPQSPSPGSGGEISGTVVAATTGGPIRGAAVSIASDDGRNLIAESDSDGRFRFSQLPSGRYHLTATQPGFLDAAYGQTRSGSGAPGVAIRLADGQRLERVVLPMARGGALSGIVFDSYGDPAFGASVTALRYTWTSTGRALSEVATLQTDERGLYRIAILPPGDYVVKASAPDASSGESVTFAPLYHPGVASLGEAGVLTLDVSEERAGINVSLQRWPTRRVSGMVVDTDGRPPTRPLMIAIRDADAPEAPVETGTQVVDGRFTFAGLAPGRYTITVLAGSGVQAIAQMSEAMFAGDAAGDGPTRAAQADVTIIDRDISEVRLALQPGASVSGRVVADGGAPLPDLSRARVNLAPADSRSIRRPVPGVPIDAAGRFKIDGVPPGRYRFWIEAAASALRSAIVNGRDTLDFPLDVELGSNVTDAVLTLTDRSTGVSGTLSDAAGQPTSDYMVVVFAADQRYWSLPSRRIAAIRPSSDGRYEFHDLPAGEYRLAVLTEARPGQWFDPRFLNELAAASILLRLAEGEERSQDVRAVKGR